jgi:hypothetical protein
VGKYLEKSQGPPWIVDPVLMMVVVVVVEIIIVVVITLSALCRVFTLMYLKQTMFLGYKVLHLFRACLLFMVHTTLSSILNSFVLLC